MEEWDWDWDGELVRLVDLLVELAWPLLAFPFLSSSFLLLFFPSIWGGGSDGSLARGVGVIGEMDESMIKSRLTPSNNRRYQAIPYNSSQPSFRILQFYQVWRFPVSQHLST